LIGDFVVADIELEIELPGAYGFGDVAALVGDGEADLDEFGFLYIPSNMVILVFLLGVLTACPADANTGKLCILGKIIFTIAMTLKVSHSFIIFLAS
jgi:hypothetical protein